MIIGYNAPRPKRENYKNFLDKLVRGLEKLDYIGLSLMLYGSYVRNDYVPGRSDIDAVLTFSDHVVINKEKLHQASIILNEALRGNDIPLQVSPLDLTTARDGRFNSFTSDFYEYFLSEGKVLVGPDYRKSMTFLATKSGEESSLSHNLRKARQALLFAEYDKQNNYEKFIEKFYATLSAVSRGSKQILYLADGKLRKNRFSALKEIKHRFPDVDTEPLARIKYLYENLEKLDVVYKNPNDVIEISDSSLSFLEKLIRCYIFEFPNLDR